jgi:hypothetical protein
MKVNIIDSFSKLPCAVGKIVGVVGMTFHFNPIAHRHYTIIVTSIKKRTMKLPFPNPTFSKIKDMANGVVLWRKKDAVIICK